MAYYTLEAEKGFLARMKETSSAGSVPTEDDLREAESWADAEVNQFVVEIVGAYDASTHITAFRASPPPEIQALAYLYGAAWVWERYSLREGRGDEETESDRLRRLAQKVEDRIRKTGYVTLSNGTLYVLSGKRKRGIVVEDPKVRAYPIESTDTSHDRTTRFNLQSVWERINVGGE